MSIFSKVKNRFAQTESKTSLSNEEWFFATRTSQSGYNDVSMFNIKQNEANNKMFYKMWKMFWTYLDITQKDLKNEKFASFSNGNKTIYFYAFKDGRVDWQKAPIYSTIALVVPQARSQNYSLEDFKKEIYSKKEALKERALSAYPAKIKPTSFDLAISLPIVWQTNSTWVKKDVDKVLEYRFETMFVYNNEDLKLTEEEMPRITSPFYNLVTNKYWMDLKPDDCELLLDLDKRLRTIKEKIKNVGV